MTNFQHKQGKLRFLHEIFHRDFKTVWINNVAT